MNNSKDSDNKSNSSAKNDGLPNLKEENPNNILKEDQEESSETRAEEIVSDSDNSESSEEIMETSMRQPPNYPLKEI